MADGTTGEPWGAPNRPAGWAGVGVAGVGLALVLSVGVDSTLPDAVGIVGGVAALAGFLMALWHFTDARSTVRRPPATGATTPRPFCPYCGKAARSAARFCPTCGHSQ